MKRMTFAAALLAGSFSVAAYAADGSGAIAPTADTAVEKVAESSEEAAALTREGYANASAIGNMYEIEAANIAWERSKSDEIKAFAKMLIADHTAANSKLEVVVSQADGSLPSSLDEEHQKLIDVLKDAEDATFDQTFLAQQVTAHEKALEMHEAYVTSGDDAALKDFAAESVKTVQAHLKQVQGLQGS